MRWVLRLVETGVDGSSRSVDVLEIVASEVILATSRLWA